MTAVQRPEDIVTVYVHSARIPYASPSYAHYVEIRDLQDVFSETTIFSRTLAVAATDQWTEGMTIEMAEGNFFNFLGLAPALGRLLLPEDDQEGAARVAMISYALWQDRFGGSAEIIGQPLRLDGDEYRIVGVMPKGFVSLLRDWNSQPRVWVTLRPFTSESAQSRRSNLSPILARLRPGQDIESANAQLSLLPERLSRDPQDFWEVIGMEALPVAQARIWPGRRGPTSQLLNMLAAVSGLVLLAASFNVANFFIARFSSRKQELSTRLALGATRMRIARLLLLEAVLIAIGAGLIGLIVSVVLVQWLSQVPSVFLRIQLALESGFNFGIVLMATTVLAACTLIFGLIPAMLISFRNPLDQLRHVRNPSGWNARRVTPRHFMMTGQIALAVVLTISAGLYGRSFWNVAELDPGYPTDSVLIARIITMSLPSDERRTFYETFLDRLNAHPNVAAASIGWNPPFAVGFDQLTVAGDEIPPIMAGMTAAAPRFFETHRIPVIEGRGFTWSDVPDDGLIINSVAAQALWPGTSAIGRVVHAGSEDRDRTIIGVVSFDRCRELKGPVAPCAWRPFPNSGIGYLRIRTLGDPLIFVPEIRRMLQELHPDVALTDIDSLEGFLARLSAPERLSAIMAISMALLGIVIVAIGCFSLWLSMVRENAPEIAVRIAIGATPENISCQIVLHATLFAVVGSTVGVIGALGVSRVLANQLFEVDPTDFVTFSCSVIGIIGIVLLGSYWPALYAGRTDPAATLNLL